MLAAEVSRGRLLHDDSNGPPWETSHCFIGTLVSRIKLLYVAELPSYKKLLYSQDQNGERRPSFQLLAMFA